MRIEVVDKNNIFVFINSDYLDKEDFNSKEDVIFTVKDFMQVYKKKLHLRGFYKVRVYVNRRIGLFLDIMRLEEIDLSNTVDLRVIVHMNEKVYFETEEFDILPEDIDKYYYNHKFYCDCSLLPNILNIIEFGRFVYGSRALDILDKAKVV